MNAERIEYFSEAGSRCLAVEVYLPKRIQNQGALIHLLLDVVELEKAKGHLSRRFAASGVEGGRLSVRPVCILAPEVDQAPLGMADVIEGIKTGMIGYSIYEVDGAFHDQDGPSGAIPALKAAAEPSNNGARRVPIRQSSPLVVPARFGGAFSTADEVNDATRTELLEYLESHQLTLSERPTVANGPCVELGLSSGTIELQLLNQDETDRESGCRRVVARKYLKLCEERTLVIRFLIDLGVGVVDGELIRYEGGKIVTGVKRIVEALYLLGEYLVCELGGSVGVEDEIWIYYDIGHVWKWKKGAATPSASEARH